MTDRAAEVIIGVDVGTTAVKVAAFGINGAERKLAKGPRVSTRATPSRVAGARSGEGAV